MVRVRAEMAGLVRAKGGAGSQEELKQQLDLGRKVGPKLAVEPRPEVVPRAAGAGGEPEARQDLELGSKTPHELGPGPRRGP